MTPELYATFPGPYNRRNVYGAASVLADNKATKPMLEDVMRYTFCGEHSVWKQRGIDTAEWIYPITVNIQPKSLSTLNTNLEIEFEEYCTE